MVHGYVWQYEPSKPLSSAQDLYQHYELRATWMAKEGILRCFWVSDAGVIRSARGRPAGRNDMVVE
jgi:hypothetical protein